MSVVIQGVINELWRPIRGPMVVGFNDITDEFASLKKLSGFTPLSPREMKFAVDLRFGGGTAWTSSGGSTARASSNKPVEAVIAWNHLTGRFDIDYDMADAAVNNRFKKAELKQQLAWQGMDKIRSMKRAVSFFFWGKPDGVVAKINSAAGAPTYTLKDRYGVTGLSFVGSPIIRVGDYVACIDPAGPTVRDIEKVTAVNTATPSITTENALASAAANDLIVLANHIDAVTTDHTRSMAGFFEHRDNTSFQGIAEADYPDEWVPGYEANLGAALNGQNIFKILATAQRKSGKKINWNFTTVGVIAAAGGAELSQIRYQGQQDELDIGFEGVKVQGLKLRPSDWCPPGHFWGDSTESLFKVSPDDDIEKVKEGGAEFHYYQNQLGFFCDLVFRCDLARKNRAAMVALNGVTEA